MKSKKFFAFMTLSALLTLCLTAEAWAAMSDEDFVHLCERGSAQKIRAALKKGANPNAMAEGTESASVVSSLLSSFTLDTLTLCSAPLYSNCVSLSVTSASLMDFAVMFAVTDAGCALRL